MKLFVLFPVLFLLILSGCAAPQPVSRQELEADFDMAYPSSYCRYEASKATGMGPFHYYYRVMYNMDTFNEIYRQCVALRSR